jgi:hypothetical protein
MDTLKQMTFVPPSATSEMLRSAPEWLARGWNCPLESVGRDRLGEHEPRSSEGRSRTWGGQWSLREEGGDGDGLRVRSNRNG